MKISVVLAFAAAICLSLLHAAPAQALLSRTWVSGTGDDANSCQLTTPCKTFQGALSKTDTAGEIACLGPGGFGGVTITKSVSIICKLGTDGVAVTGGNAITVNTPANSVVILQGLDIDGLGTASIGISFTGAGVLHVQQCLIRNFTGGSALGISFKPTAAAKLFVEDSYISDNGTSTAGGGISIVPGAGGSAQAELNRVSLNDNALGVRSDGTGNAGVNLSIESSTMAGSIYGGVIAFTPAGGGAVNVMVDQSDISNNGGNGLDANGAAATIRFARSIVTGNNASLRVLNSATLLSYGDNDIDGNTTNTLPTTTMHH